MTSILYIDGGGPVEVEFIGLQPPQIDSSTYTVAGVDFGEEVSGRKIVAAVHFTFGSARNLTATTIGGQTAPIVVPNVAQDLNVYVAFIAAGDVSGTSGDIVLTFSGQVTLHGVGVWRMINATSITPIDTATLAFSSTATNDITVNPDAESGGAVFAAGTYQHNDGLPTFAAGIALPDYSAAPRGDASARVIGGFALTPSTVSGMPVTFRRQTTLNWQGGSAAVSFR